MKSLVVDDEQMSRTMLSTILEGHGDCVQAATGEEAVTLYGEALDSGAPFDLVCLDIGMPVLDGLSALQRLRDIEQSHGEEGKCRVFMTTASNHYEDLSAAFFNGRCDEYLLKPFSREEMTQLLTRYALA